MAADILSLRESCSTRSIPAIRFPLPSSTPSFSGSLAIASPALDESDFARAVVLLMQHNQDGAFGAVLNRPPNEEIKRAWTTLTGNVNDSQRNISLGGPCNGPVFALHQQAELGDQQVQCGLYFNATKEGLLKLAQEAETPYRVFFGAAAWVPGQLEQEIERGAWWIAPATDETIFCAPAYQWAFAVRHYGRLAWNSLGVHGFPREPGAN